MVFELTCSFCDRPQSEVRRLIAGTGVAICDGCVALATDVVRQGTPGEDPPISPAVDGTRCTFCEKSAGEVPERAVAHTGAAVVCTECLDLCHEILAEELAGPG